jgi:choline transport protein
MPNTATVYHWARVTGGRHGSTWSWYAGWWCFAAWELAAASLVSFMALQVLGMYGVTHPDFVVQGWHITVAYLACNWALCLFVLFGDKWLSMVESCGLLFTTSGWIISIIICAVMPSVNGNGYANSSDVWTGWQNLTGWSSNGFVFCLGMLNAAFAVCAPDIPAHLAEEIPR